jgi:hypothetical protein
VKGDRFDVMGVSKVAVHDNTRKYQPGEKPYYLLEAGDTYDMRLRNVVRGKVGRDPAPTPTPTPTPTVAPLPASQTRREVVRAEDPTRSVVTSPATLPRLLDYLLTITAAENWRHVEAIDLDADGEVDFVRIHAIDPINGDPVIWEAASASTLTYRMRSS